MQASTGLRDNMLDTGSLKNIMALGAIKIFTGAAPVDADAAETGTLLVTITEASGGTQLSFAAAAASGVIAKDAAVWSGVIGAGGGVAGYYRHVAAGDTGVLSATEQRIQGSVGLAGADLNLTDLNLIDTATQTIDFYVVSLPTL